MIYDSKRKVFRTIKNPHIHKGTSDILGIFNGRFFAIEVKTPTTHKKAINHPSERDINQSKFLKIIYEHGGIAVKVSTLDSVIQLFNKIKTG